MKTAKKYRARFVKSSQRTPGEIKAACEKLQLLAKTKYDIRSNGNHIWVEVGEKKQQYWSPMLHLQLNDSGNQTSIKGEFAENPNLWLIFLITQIASIGVFGIALIAAVLKYRSGSNFNPELFAMFAMVSVWFGLYLISERYKRKGAGQYQELNDFVDYIAST